MVRAKEEPGAALPPDPLSRWAWLPVLVFLATTGSLWLANWTTPHEAPRLLALLNFVFSTVATGVVAVVAGMTFVTRGGVGVLLLGTGALVMGVAFILAPVVGRGDPNIIATVHNTGMLLAALLHVAGAASTTFPRRPVARPPLVLGAAYVLGVAAMIVVAEFALAGMTPVFFVPGRGGTPLRQMVLVTAAGMFSAASLVVLAGRRDDVGFRRWYGLGLLLLAIGLLGVMLQPSLGSAISWTGRSAQYLGGLYLVVAVATVAARTRRWAMPLETALRDAEDQAEQLRLARQQLAFVLEGSRDGFWDWNLATDHVTYSARWAEMFGYAVADLEPSISTWRRMLHPGDEAKALQAMEAIRRGEVEHWETERQLRHRDGHWVWVLVRGRVVEHDPDGRPSRMAGTYTDISERKAAEVRIGEAAAYARSLIEASLDPLVTISTDGKVTDVNAATEVATGVDRDRIVGTDFADYFVEPEKARAGYKQALEIGKVRDYPLTIRNANGDVMEVLYNATTYSSPDGGVQGIFAAARDVTEIRALQSQLALTSRLAAMGTLVAGVAHEINNPLAAAMSDQGLAREFVQEIRDRLRDGGLIELEAAGRKLDETAHVLKDAMEAGARIAQIVKDLSAFGRPNPARTMVRLIDVVEKAMRWLPASVGKVATVNVENGGAPDVWASFGQIEQVIVNLVTNAARASKPGRPGEIIIRVGPGAPGMARLEVIDHGTGIDPALRERIFDPFFTTRQAGSGKGMGLGLAISYTIVANHGGALTVKSEVGKGSTFRVELPVAPAAA